MKRKFFAVLLAFIAMGSSVTFAASQDDEDKACRSDAFRLCSSEIPDRDKIEACMKQHYDQLSPQCKKVFQSSSSDSGK
ncbi:hypothetical protein [Paraburkholderia humisilvae]|uniref:Cysteine rich repeat protein n=1 Tax=Paraburkholderia humisilvae TaxID=627669 RepID=A0A6J5DNT1_9BURK|nr:hypothetical protein [Paraburkholderia humisilvae]CAB3755678.1 hypothetical protein LMG29542_02666 [Paraburkholderia humisilvae]